MKVEVLPEPELEFGGGGRHVDARFGLMNFGPVDEARPSAPKQIRLGFVGTARTIERFKAWLERCRDMVPAKESRQPQLFPAFPGFRADGCFRAELVWDKRLEREIPDREFTGLASLPPGQRVTKAVELVLSEFTKLAEDTNADVLVFAVPASLLEATEDLRARSATGHAAGEDREVIDDFHDLLKARVMRLRKPIQLVLPSTYGDKGTRGRSRKEPELGKKPQDEATRAWNLHTALYYKAGGSPWRLVRSADDKASCYVGVSFFRSRDGSRLETSVAQVFNERGDGIIVRGAVAQVSKADRSPHLARDDAHQLLFDALTKYRAEHKTLPARVVVHKSSAFDEAEAEGFASATLRTNRVDSLDLVSLSDHVGARLLRVGNYPPLRGTFLSLNDCEGLLYTKGSVEFFATYPGMYIPRPIRLRLEDADQTPRFLAHEILALSKMNWNVTQFDGAWPITLRAARRVGRVLKYLAPDEEIAPRYSSYM